jgi:hypothetical protein
MYPPFARAFRYGVPYCFDMMSPGVRRLAGDGFLHSKVDALLARERPRYGR